VKEEHIMKRLTIPEGAMRSFCWYESDPQLLAAERAAMAKFFPQFRLEMLEDRRLCWEGAVSPHICWNGDWILMLVYDHDHPNNSSYGGSVRVYSLSPDLVDTARQVGSIPHTLTDSFGNLFLCTSRPEDFRADSVTTSAASALGWAIKWINYFELWQAKAIDKEEFARHGN
jgi:hypothetical protein